ncbi:MAG: DUF4446 family protein [Candidatus Pacebacteria bacterium]|nr:DUF4446 family protein [Candidatus Paceibacterota bacterium]
MPTLVQFFIGTGVLLSLLLLWNIFLEIRLRRLTRGSDGKNLEGHLATIARDYQDLEEFKSALHSRLETMDVRLKGSVSGVGVVRFHPFAGSGDSKPSFAVAFISENGDGIIISTLHARNSVSIFSKNVSEFKSDKELTEEEAGALEKARNSLHT